MCTLFHSKISTSNTKLCTYLLIFDEYDGYSITQFVQDCPLPSESDESDSRSIRSNVRDKERKQTRLDCVYRRAFFHILNGLFYIFSSVLHGLMEWSDRIACLL